MVIEVIIVLIFEKGDKNPSGVLEIVCISVGMSDTYVKIHQVVHIRYIYALLYLKEREQKGKLTNTIRQSFSKCISQCSSSSITREHVRNANSWTPPQIYWI